MAKYGHHLRKVPHAGFPDARGAPAQAPTGHVAIPHGAGWLELAGPAIATGPRTGKAGLGGAADGGRGQVARGPHGGIHIPDPETRAGGPSAR